MSEYALTTSKNVFDAIPPATSAVSSMPFLPHLSWLSLAAARTSASLALGLGRQDGNPSVTPRSPGKQHYQQVLEKYIQSVSGWRLTF